MAESTSALRVQDLSGWQAHPERRNPIAVLQDQEADRLPWLVPVRHSRMAQDVFAFYRGTPAVMAQDLGHAPSSGLEVQLCGDCHLGNFGFYASPEWSLVFDLNDFDETIRGPFEWDLKRLVTSAVLAGRSLSLSTEQQGRVARRIARSYRKAIQKLASQSLHQVWSQRFDVDAYIQELEESPFRQHVLKLSAKARARTNSQAAGKLCELGADGELQLRHDPPLVWRHAELDRNWTAQVHWREMAQHTVERYLASLSSEVSHRLRQYRLVDAAMKAVGVGSVGTRCAIGLFMGSHPDDVLILQTKQAEASVLEPYASTPSPEHHGQRVIDGQRLMQTVSDPFLACIKGLESNRFYYCRQLRNWKGSVDLTCLDAKGLELYGELCGRALAKAHARSGDRLAIAAWLDAGKVFDQALESFGLQYAAQAEADYRLFVQAIREGQLEASVIF